MALQVDYKPIANDGAANVETQVQYEIDLGVGGELEHGYEAGTAKSAQVNKTLRQSSMMTAAMANVIANHFNADLLDDGDLPTLITKLTATLVGSAWSTGDMKPTMKTAADVGWVLMTDGTIGSGASTADYANNDAQALFLLLWNNTDNADCPVVTGRGGSAAADWAANKKITLPQTRGRALGGAGAGAGLTARALGATFGSEHLQQHHHAITTYSGGGAGQIHTAGAPSDADVQTQDAGTGDAGNMQPTTFVNWMIKL